MAGIGFELRKLLNKDSYAGLFQAYSYAGVIGSGPWVISIFAILVLSLLAREGIREGSEIGKFQVTLTWLIAFSLILTGGVQLYFTRYTADRLFEHQPGRILPNFHGAVLAAFAIALPAIVIFLAVTSREVAIAYQLLMITAFAQLCLVWLLTMVLTGLKHYRLIVLIYLFGYGITVALGYYLQAWGKEGLLAAFAIGQAILVLGLSALIWREYPSPKLVEFDLFRKGRGFPSLLATGVLFNLGIWIDKIIFWLGPAGKKVLGGLYYSPIYDTPIFLAYLTIIPGMAVFIMRVETEFADSYEHYYRSVLGGGSLSTLMRLQDEMIVSARDSIFDIVKVQSMTILLVIASGTSLLEFFSLDPVHTSLFQVYVIGVGIQVILMGALNILFYLDKRLEVMKISLVLVLASAFLTLLTLRLGPEYYGFGFVAAMLLATLVSLLAIDKELSKLTYRTFTMHG